MKIVIRAGGVGSRLWPVSREAKPKQFHALTSQLTMLQEAIERVRTLTAPSDIFVSTSSLCEPIIRADYPDIPAANVIVEPARRDTAAAIGLESIIIAHTDPQAIVASLGSDHSVRRVPEFQRMITIAAQFIERHPSLIVPVGVRPTHPDTGYGYIQLGTVLDTIDGKNFYQVDRFTEKPDIETAKQFLQEAAFLWNANMFVWRVDTILGLYQEHLPDMYQQLQEIAAAVGTPHQQAVIDRVYPTMQHIAIDYGIIEKTNQIAAISAEIGWNDVGDWARLKDELAESEADNVSIQADHLALDTRNTLVYSARIGKLIATANIENLVIVDTDDALLVCDKYSSSRVKDIVEQLHAASKDQLL